MADKYLQDIDASQNLEILQNLDLSLFAGLFSKLAGEAHCLAIVDLNLRPITSSDPIFQEQLEAAFTKETNPSPDLVVAEGLDLGAVGKLMAIALDDIGNAGTGLLVALAPNHCPQEQLRRLKEGLADIAQAINLLCGKEYELIDMTEEVAVRYEELNIVYDFGDIIRQHLRGETLYKALLQLSVDRLEVDLAVFIHPGEDSTTFIIKPGKKFDELDLLLTRMRSEIYRFVASSKQPFILNRMDDQRRDYLWTGMPYKFLAAPVIFQKRMKALLVILRDNNGVDFSNSDRKLMEVVCEQVGTLIHNEEMYNALFVFTEQMAGALIEAVDAKDPYTRGHSDRVNYYAMQLGKAKKLSDAELQTLYWASLLHDLGKIAVPDIVLSKPGKLDEDEYTLIKIHPERGYDILKNVEQLQKSLPGMRHHHERFDGDGYPHGLSGDDIPLHARIIAIADTYDAITTSRSYRPARSHEQAMAAINEVSGSQLDPELVTLWNELMSTGPESDRNTPPFPERQ